MEPLNEEERSSILKSSEANEADIDEYETMLAMMFRNPANADPTNIGTGETLRVPDRDLEQRLAEKYAKLYPNRQQGGQ